MSGVVVRSITVPKMPQDCAFGNCKNVAKRGSGCRFFCFPSERLQRKRRKLWIAAVAAVNETNEDGTPWLPHSNSRVCSAHFMTGKLERLFEREHLSWAGRVRAR